MRMQSKLTEYAKGFIEGNGSHLAGRIKYLHDLNQPYIYQDAVDPSASMQVEGDYVSCPAFTILGDRERPRVHHIYTMDIEAWGLNPDRLHFGCIMNAADEGDYQIFRSWHNVVEHTKKPSANGRFKKDTEIKEVGAVERIEDILIERSMASKDPVRIHMYAHFGEKFDYRGLASHIMSNRYYAPEYKHLAKEELDEITGRPTRKARYDLHPEVRPFMDKGLYNGKTTIYRRRYWKNDETGEKTALDITWSLRILGKYSYIIVQSGYSTLWLLDSYWHLSEPLKEFGAKGDTPLQYIDPEKWLEERVEAGDLVVDTQKTERQQIEQKMLFWYEWLDQESVEYCVQDCRILSQALKDYSELVASEFKIPGTNKPLFALAYLTPAQLAKAGQIVSQKAPKIPGNGVLVMDSGKKWYFETGLDGLKEKMDAATAEGAPYVRMGIPFARRSVAKAVSSGWYCSREHVLRWRAIQFGGRTEVFKPMNSPGTKVFMLDAKSHYPSQMIKNRYLDPRRIFELPNDIVGRKAILEHLENHSGMYLIKTRPSMDPIVRDRVPVFPFRIGAEDYDGRLMFGTWDGYFMRHVTGEELRYFLEIADVEDGDIRVIGGKSWYAPLLDVDETPFYQFIIQLYKQRLKAVEEGDNVRAKMLKRLMNSGGYGIHVQQNSQPYKIRESDPGNRTQDAIVRMIAMTPEWEGWDRLEEMTPEQFRGVEIVRLAQDWARSHYRGTRRMDISRGVGLAPYMQIEIELPEKQAPHAIRPWGCSIAANGRVGLHKPLLAVMKADARFALLYCDTDSVYFEVPEWMEQEEVVRKLESVKIGGKQIINIGNDLGDWEIQLPEANKALVVDGCDVDDNGLIRNPQGVFLAPKHYYLLDRHFNVLKDTVKSIPKNATEMRCIMQASFPQNAKLGDPKGSNNNAQTTRNLIDQIYNGSGAKRIYPSMTAISYPVVFKNVSEDQAEGKTCLEYIRMLSDCYKSSNRGIRATVDYYIDNCKIRGRSFDEVQLKMDRMISSSQMEMASAPEIIQHESMLAEILHRKGIYNPEASEPDGLPI